MARGKHRKPVFIAPPPQPFQDLPAVPSVSVSVLGSKNATVAKVRLAKPTADWMVQEYQFEVAESSKREQGDVFDPVTGELLALGRAFQRLSRQLFSEAGKRVRESVAEQERLEAERERKAEAAKKPVKRRTKEEWEAMRAEKGYMIPPGFAEELREFEARQPRFNTALEILEDSDS